MKRIFTTILIAVLSLMSVSCSSMLADLGLGGDSRNALSDNSRETTCDSDDDDCVDEGADRSVASRNGGGDEDDGFEHNPGLSAPMRQRVRDAIESNDVIPGMTRSEVVQSWGEPVVREFAGQGDSGHERWTYGTRSSLRGETYLIFENGRVVGWHR